MDSQLPRIGQNPTPFPPVQLQLVTTDLLLCPSSRTLFGALLFKPRDKKSTASAPTMPGGRPRKYADIATAKAAAVVKRRERYQRTKREETQEAPISPTPQGP
jgi:hypothetical protein